MDELAMLGAAPAGAVGIGLVLGGLRGAGGDGVGLLDATLGIAGAILLGVGALYAPTELAIGAASVAGAWILDRLGLRLPERLRRRLERRRAEDVELERRDVERREVVDPYLPPL